MTTIERCGLCNADLSTPTARSTHTNLDPGILCGEFARRTMPVAFSSDAPPTLTDAQRVKRARAAVETIVEYLVYHQREHDSPVEVDTPGGWMDAIDLITPLEDVLGVDDA